MDRRLEGYVFSEKIVIINKAFNKVCTMKWTNFWLQLEQEACYVRNSHTNNIYELDNSGRFDTSGFRIYIMHTGSKYVVPFNWNWKLKVRIVSKSGIPSTPIRKHWILMNATFTCMADYICQPKNHITNDQNQQIAVVRNESSFKTDE